MPTYNDKDQYLSIERIKYWNNSPPNSESNPNINTGSIGWADNGRGVLQTIRNSNPDWRQRLAKRQDVSSAYKREGWVTPLKHSWARVRANNQWVPYPSNTTVYETTQRVGMPRLDMVRIPEADDRANASIKRKLANRVGDMALMAPIAELTELRSSISGLAKMTTDLVKSLIDIKRTKGKSAAKYAGDAWLTFGFGVAPTVGTVKDLCAAIQRFKDRQDRTERLIGGADRSWKTSSTFKGTGSISSIALMGDWDITNTYSVRYIGGFDLLIKSAEDYGALNHFHLDEWESLIPMFWELMAYSWVYDYFTTVGAWLEDVFTSDPSKCIYLVKSERYTAEISGTVRARANRVYSYQNYWEDYYDDAEYYGKYFNFQRTPLTKLPNRALRFKTVDEIGKHGVNKVLNLASVLIQGTGYEAYYRPFETSKVSFYDTMGAERRAEMKYARQRFRT